MSEQHEHRALTPADVHPSHDVRDQGILVSDPVCQKCKRGAVENSQALRDECDG